MKNKIKQIILPALALSITACGGSNSSGNASSDNNFAPVIDTSVLADDYSEIIKTQLPVFDSDALLVEQPEIDQWEYNFLETDRTFVNSRNEAVNYFEIDLRKGVSDADLGSYLEVKELEYIWRGPNCADTLVAAVNYEEYCKPFLAEFGFEPGDNVTPFEAIDIRDFQNLPRIFRPIYGFEFKQNHLLVTPEEFAPLLRQDETAQLHLRYKVSDGENFVIRYLKVTVNGIDSAPGFYERNDDGTFVMVDHDTDPSTPEVRKESDPESISASEKSAPFTINLLQDFYDDDLELVKELTLENGDLWEKYNEDSSYRGEDIEIVDVKKSITSEFLTQSEIDSINLDLVVTEPELFRDTVFNAPVASHATFTPSALSELLALGESATVVINYQVFDGNNTVDRSYTVRVDGADLFNPPRFDNAELNKTIATIDGFTTFSFLEGVSDPDGDRMEIVDFTASARPYGADLSTAGIVKVDPYFFTYLKPGEKEMLTYTYKVSDGDLVSPERTFNIEITGSSFNLMGQNSDFELGDETNWIHQWSPSGSEKSVVAMDAALNGDYGFRADEDNVYYRADLSLIDNTELEEGTRFYFNHYARLNNAWNAVRTFWNKNGQWSGAGDHLYIGRTSPAGAAAGTWSEHTTTYIGDEFLDSGDVNFTFIAGNDEAYDDFSIVKYSVRNDRNLISNSNFNNNSVDGWTAGSASVMASADASSNPNPQVTEYGLEVIGDAAWNSLTYNNLPEGSIKNGMRYILEFQMQNPGYDTDTNSSREIRVALNSGGEVARKITFDGPTSPTAWETYQIHINTVSQGNDYDGAVVSDLDYDWESANDVTLTIMVSPNQHFRFDNIRFYPVPQ